MTSDSLIRRALLGVTLVTAAACVTITPPAFLEPAPARDWKTTLDAARTDAAAGRFAAADSLLAAYDGHYAGTPQAVETRYWRAVFDLDPTNALGSPTTALSLLDAYIGDPSAGTHMDEARSLRGVAFALDSLRRYAAAVSDALQSSTTTNAASHVSESRGEVTNGTTKTAEADADEIKRLKDELAKANDELDRIKKRLAAPAKPPGD